MKTIGFFVICLAILGVFAMHCVQALGVEKRNLPSVDVATLSKRLSSGNPPFLLDVREPSEYAESHIDGARLIPIGTIPDHLSEIPRDTPVVVICRSGNRSAKATDYLMTRGYTNVENMIGGMNAWAARSSL